MAAQYRKQRKRAFDWIATTGQGFSASQISTSFQTGPSKLLDFRWTGIQFHVRSTISYWRLQGKNNRYASFCPPRDTIEANWYVDGKDTYKAMADGTCPLLLVPEMLRSLNAAIDAAKYNIFVADWFMIAPTYMRRDHPPSLSNRFDKMVQRKAAQVLLHYKQAPNLMHMCRV